MLRVSDFLLQAFIVMNVDRSSSPGLARVVIAGVAGGLVVFFCGFVAHMLFNWGGRAFSRLPNEETVRNFFTVQNLPAGIYGFPEMKQDVLPEEAEVEWKRVGDLYREGPAAYIIVAPKGQEMMDGKTLGMECLTNVAAALLASLIASWLAPDRGFKYRWATVLLMGLFAWFSLSASYNIWYRFPWPFVRDELLCSAFEWGVAGLVIAAILKVRRPPPGAPV